MVALDASFKAYAASAEQASSQATTRMVTERVLQLIRTGTVQGPTSTQRRHRRQLLHLHARLQEPVHQARIQIHAGSSSGSTRWNSIPSNAAIAADTGYAPRGSPILSCRLPRRSSTGNATTTPSASSPASRTTAPGSSSRDTMDMTVAPACRRDSTLALEDSGQHHLPRRRLDDAAQAPTATRFKSPRAKRKRPPEVLRSFRRPRALVARPIFRPRVRVFLRIAAPRWFLCAFRLNAGNRNAWQFSFLSFSLAWRGTRS